MNMDNTFILSTQLGNGRVLSKPKKPLFLPVQPGSNEVICTDRKHV